LKDDKLNKMMADLLDENRAITIQDENGTGISLYGNRPSTSFSIQLFHMAPFNIYTIV